MDDRTMDSTYDPKKPWHILMKRGEEWLTVSTYDTAVEVILAVGVMSHPESIMVRHVPTDTDGSGNAFLHEANRRMRQHA